MTKYRTLSGDELKSFENEFISFLVVNGIQPEDWIKLKTTSKEKTNAILDQFSEVIFESIFRKSNFIDHVSQKSIKCFQFLENEVILVGVDASAESNIDFLSEQPLNEIMENNIDNLQVYQTKKSYQLQREVEMFNMTASGAVISKGQLFKQLCLLL